MGYDPLAYAIFFPNDEPGWHPNIKRRGMTVNDDENDLSNIQEEDEGRRLTVSMREYYCYKFQIRATNNSLLLGLVDGVNAREMQPKRIGKRIVLPASFIGGPRDMRRRFRDAMTLVQDDGKLDIFLTMTCNPNWQEIKTELLHGQTAADRPDLVARVFRAKLEDLKKMLLTNIFSGRVVSAEIPNPTKYPELYKLLLKHMMHGPCGCIKPDSPCMQGEPKVCRFRRDDGMSATIRKETLDNRWVVLYNPKLLMMFNCHMNVEAENCFKFLGD
uniref:ATP-dependent DNA helicase PIF1 n=1 Tax=Tanacetum cinerariifolium TaxID=118510 RepID=A0A699KD67_TANCI|nr:ATP-dependent DNA helicase PIF1 [Tanacetum cinerariifolium]